MWFGFAHHKRFGKLTTGGTANARPTAVAVLRPDVPQECQEAQELFSKFKERFFPARPESSIASLRMAEATFSAPC